MKRKISVILIIIIMLFVAIMGHIVFAAESIGSFLANFRPDNPKVGDEVVIDFSSTALNEGISTISMELVFDDNIFTVSNVVAGEGWTKTVLENTYFISTIDQEKTNEIGNIITFYLKVKEGVQVGTQTTVTLSSIQVATDGDPVDLDNLSQVITISSYSPDQDEDDSSKNEITNNEVVDNEVIDNEVIDNEIIDNEIDNNNQVKNEIENKVSNEIKNEVENNVENDVDTDNLLIEKINGLTYSSADKEVPNEVKEVPKIPQTGDNDYLIIISIVGITILSIISYVIYRKNKF